LSLPPKPAGAWLATRSQPAFAVSRLDLYVKTETYEIFRHPEGDRKASCGGQLKAKIQSQNSTSIAPAVNPANQEPPSRKTQTCAARSKRAARQPAIGRFDKMLVSMQLFRVWRRYCAVVWPN
jgi:hypothetical protein